MNRNRKHEVGGKVYGLFDPRTGELRYVGKTAYALSFRLSQHLSNARRKVGDYWSTRWLRQLLAAGKQPVVHLLDLCATDAELNEAEVWFIAYFKKLGARLTNARAGGEGGRLSEASREKISASLRGKPGRPLGTHWPEASRKAWSEKQKGKAFTQGQKNAVRAGTQRSWDSGKLSKRKRRRVSVRINLLASEKFNPQETRESAGTVA
jgi:hypothetical protein